MGKFVVRNTEEVRPKSRLLEDLDPGGLLNFLNRKFPMDISFLIDLHSHRSMGILKSQVFSNNLIL
jgi:hypothetical protein